MTLYTIGELEAAHLTGKTRVRANWRGKLILQVQIKHPNASYPQAPRPGPYDPWKHGHHFFWRDATVTDLQAIGTVGVDNLKTEIA